MKFFSTSNVPLGNIFQTIKRLINFLQCLKSYAHLKKCFINKKPDFKIELINTFTYKQTFKTKNVYMIPDLSVHQLFTTATISGIYISVVFNTSWTQAGRYLLLKKMLKIGSIVFLIAFYKHMCFFFYSLTHLNLIYSSFSFQLFQ